jgi:glycine cleavage system transcriptional repressor
VAQTLAEAKINISDLNAQQIQGETGPVYLMMIEASLPPGWTCQRLEDLLGPLIAHQAVEISVRELEQLTF